MRFWNISTTAANRSELDLTLYTHLRAVTGFFELQHTVRINVSSQCVHSLPTRQALTDYKETAGQTKKS
jgi:hypothetical protein